MGRFIRWSKNKTRRFGGFDILTAREIIHEEFYEGHFK